MLNGETDSPGKTILGLPSDHFIHYVIERAAERQISGVHHFRVSLCPLIRVIDMHLESQTSSAVRALRHHPSPIPSLCQVNEA